MNKPTYYEMNLHFISLGSVPVVIPKDHSFLKKYFKTKIQRQFLFYYYVFRDSHNFQHHVGVRCDASFVYKMTVKFEWIMAQYNTAKRTLNFELLGKIQRRRLKLLKNML
jgi:hypothetical protein